MIVLRDIIALVESNDNTCAIRFEPTIYAKSDTMPVRILNAILDANKCSQKTAQMIYSTSWGRYQIMGFNLYGLLAWKKSIVEYLVDPFTTQDISFDDFTAEIRRSTGEASWDGTRFTNVAAQQSFARWYNGPGNVPAYMGRMNEAAERLVKAESAAH